MARFGIKGRRWCLVLLVSGFCLRRQVFIEGTAVNPCRTCFPLNSVIGVGLPQAAMIHVFKIYWEGASRALY